MTIKIFLLKLFPFLSRFFKVTAPVAVTVPQTSIPAALQTPTVDVAPVVATPVAPSPVPYVLAPSTASYYDPNRAPAIPNNVLPFVDRNSKELVVGRWVNFIPGSNDFKLKAEGPIGPLLSVAGGDGEIHVSATYSDGTTIDGFVATNAGSKIININRADDVQVKVIANTGGTVERQGA